MRTMVDSSLFIGRFQPFHLGHLFVLKQCPTKSVIIGVGSSQYHHTLDNPFSYEERKHMIELVVSSLLNKRYEVYAIPDIHDPPNWVEHVKSIVPSFSVVLTNNDFTSQLFTEKGVNVHSPGLYERKKCMGEEIRMRMIQQKEWHHLVPTEVASYLEEIDAVKRLQLLSEEKDSC